MTLHVLAHGLSSNGFLTHTYSNSCTSQVVILKEENIRLQQELDVFKYKTTELQMHINSLTDQCESVRRCTSNGVYYADGDVWYPDPCTTCRCEVDKINCYTSYHSPYCELQCNDNTCLNGGECMASLSKNSVQCSCPNGFSGPLCEQSVSSCSPVFTDSHCSHNETMWLFDSYSNQCKSLNKGCFEVGSTFRSFEECSTTCLQGTCCYRMKIGEISDMICQAETMKNCQVLCQDTNVDVLGFYPGIKCPTEGCGMIASKVCHSGMSLYSPGTTFTFGCETCECSEEHISCSCQSKYVRREIRELSYADRIQYQQAISHLLLGSEKSTWTSLRNLYVTHVMHANSPQYFLFWNRYFLWSMERHLQQFNCSITIPYFDFTLDSGNMSSSVIWRKDFLGPHRTHGSNCQRFLIDKSNETWTPCIKRRIKTHGNTPTMVDVAIALSKSDFYEFTSALQGIATYIHDYIGGDMETTSSPHDPIFYSVHAYIDSLFWKWEQRYSNRTLSEKFRNEILNGMLIPFNTKQKYLIDSDRNLCVTYERIENTEKSSIEYHTSHVRTDGQHARCIDSDYEPEIRSVIDAGHRIQSVLYNQDEKFLKSLPRTCTTSENISGTYNNQIWNVNAGQFEAQSNYQPIEANSVWCDRFCFTADIFLLSENEEFIDTTCSINQIKEQQPICEESALLQCPYYTYVPCRLSLCGNCSLICHVNNQDIECISSKLDFCNPNPCMNGGICLSSEWPTLPHLVQCDCPPGFEGEHCQYTSTQRCSLPQDHGKGLSGCGTPVKRWYFDLQRQECYSFMYQGCSGNANNFNSYYDCRVSCIIGACCWRTPRHPDRTPGFNAAGYDRYGFTFEGQSWNKELRTFENGFGGEKAIYRFQNLDYEGYNKFGYNVEGIDRYGYRKDGYHNVTKFNITGYNINGERDGNSEFDILGYNSDGYNRAGFNCYGHSKNNWDYYGLSTGWNYECQSKNQKECESIEEESPSSKVQIISFSPGKKCDETQWGEHCGCQFVFDSYTVGQKFHLGCAECECTQSGRISCPCVTSSIRKEIRDMTFNELKRFQNALKTVALRGEGTTSWQNITNLYSQFLPQFRGSSLFLPWHRFFLRYVELKMQEIDCSVSIPYFDWTLDVGSMATSVVWQANYFGGDGDPTKNHCVRYHPFKNFHPAYWNSCLRRNFNSSIYVPNAVELEKILRTQNFDQFSSEMSKISGLFHIFVGGHMGTTEAAYDPIFFAYYAFIDKLWVDWTSRRSDNAKAFPYDVRYIPLKPFGVSSDDVLRSDVQLCVLYKDITEGAPCIDESNNSVNVPNLIQPKMINVHGFDTEGYDTFGFDQMGWKRTGIFRDSFNRDGFGSDGFDRNGFNRYGIDRFGCNVKGRCFPDNSQQSQISSMVSLWDEFNPIGYRPTGFDFHGYDTFGFDVFGYDRSNCSFYFNGPFYPIFMKNARKDIEAMPSQDLNKVSTICQHMSNVPEWWTNLYWLNRDSVTYSIHLSPSARSKFDPFSSNKDAWLAPTPEERFCFQLHHHSKCPLSRPPVPCPFHTCTNRFCPTLPSAQCRNFGCGSCESSFFNVVTQKPSSCNKNDCISVDGNIKIDGEVWEEELCFTCSCQAGLVSCSSTNCDVTCDHPVVRPASCCPICDGCMKNGIMYTNGESFIDPLNPCLICTCTSGSILCTAFECAPIKSCLQNNLVTLHGECCPICSMCGPHDEGSRWMESPCHDCICQMGEVKCNVIECPLPSCQYPARRDGECCRRCEDCEYQGNFIRNEEVFRPEKCIECKCQKGNMPCLKIECSHPVCIERRHGFEECCQGCQKGCQYDGKEFEDGSTFKPSFNPCLNCSCQKGLVRCLPGLCPKPEVKCELPVFLPGECCPQCPRCLYREKEYTNGQRWRVSNNSCETCVCLNGIVSCSEKEMCPGQRCTHGIVPEGQCCSSCTDCKYNDHVVLDKMQFSPPNDPCSRCVCNKGNITCIRETCPRLLCSATELPNGACCPVCKGCTNEIGRVIDHGQHWVHASDVCQLCSCKDGVSACERIACRIPCTHPVMKPDVCCPECNDCQVLGKIYQNNVEIPSNDPCRRCYCYKGNMECESVSCPAMTCPNPMKEAGQCCPVCKECFFQGSVYKDKETFQPQSDACYSCNCDKGAVYCVKRDDRCNPQCSNPVRLSGQCCPVCDGCEYEGKSLKNKDIFIPNSVEPCLQCECIDGNVRCYQKQCATLNCLNRQRVPNECCEQCLEYCVDNNNAEKIYKEGKMWLSDDKCSTCSCQNSVINCHHVACLPTRCDHPAAPFGVCCPECDHCEFTNRLYRNGQEFTHEDDPCQLCKCKNGTVSCETIICDPLPCLHPEPLVGLCCPICSPDIKCHQGGKTYDAWENFLDPVNPCSECVCVDGMSSCHPVLCLNPECPNPQFGHCCDSCEGCSYGEKNYINHISFLDPHNSCRDCQCENGAVSCQQLDCEPVTCESPIHVVGECCPVCRSCLYKNNMYHDGETFRDPENDCSECVCQYPDVFCQMSADCTETDCIDTNSDCRNKNSECQFYDEMYESGSVFLHPENACEVCSCQNGMVTCFDQHCPPLQCTHPVQTNCCSVCDEGCFYAGSIYQERLVFPNPYDSCQECVCKQGNVTCQQMQCSTPICQHPSSNGCCPVCEDCTFKKKVIANGNSFNTSEVNDCQTCVCLNGNVECHLLECTDVACSHPVTFNCCPSCDIGCFYNGKKYQQGEETASESACEVCRCNEGSVNCQLKSCPIANCSYPVIRDCCPICNSGCEVDDQFYNNGEDVDFPNNPCDICTCSNGNVTCHPKPCSPVTCSHPAMKNCCPVCDSGCTFHDAFYLDSEIFNPPSDMCETCTCSKGNVECEPKFCEVVRCSNPVLEDCCPVCNKGCFYEGQIYNFGAEFDDPANSCYECACMKGTVYCDAKPCDPVDCINAITEEGNCCPYCPDYCVYNGKRYEIESVFPHEMDPCNECKCLNGDVECDVKICPDVQCLHPAPGECCLECKNCFFHESIHEHDTNFTNPENPCETCLCSGGQVACETTPCLQCLHPVLKNSTCCPSCDDCFYEEIQIANQQIFVSPTDPCDECICKNGTVTCHKLSCSLPPCSNPSLIHGHCCPVCPGCEVSGMEFTENEEFTHPEDVCRKCICKEGHVACNNQICERNCTHPIPDPCCPICDDCMFERVKYSNGDYFNPDSCRRCHCKNGNAVCTTEVCPELNCRLKTRLPGQCCETCRGCVYDGQDYENNATWISTSNPCLSCICSGGIVSCTNMVCPVLCAEPIPVPGSCCPVCPDCEQEGIVYKSGERFSPASRPCDSCTCDSGHIFCIRHECPVLDCPEEAIKSPSEGECCPTCAAFGSTCTRDQIGQLFHPHPDPCFVCQCSESFMWVCSKEFCPVLNCPSEEIIRNKKECCPKCKVCISEAFDLHYHGDIWSTPNDPCKQCICNYGITECKKIICPTIRCEGAKMEFRRPGECCPICTSSVDLACNYGGAFYENEQNWKPDPCTTCLCTHGKMHCHNERCFPLDCTSDEIPSVAPGQCCPTCTPRPATCLAFGDPHYRTFDGASVSFQGTCRYVLTADCYSQKFTILVENNDRGFSGVSWTHRVVVVLQNASVDLRAGPSVYIKGKFIEHLPYFDDPVLYVEKTGTSVLVTTNVGVQVLWNGDGYVEVTVSGEFRGKTCGLCGNFNYFLEDDMKTPANRTVTSEAEFGNSWKYGDVQPGGCTESVDIDPCSVGGYRIRKIANTKCSVLKQSLFAPCHRFIQPETFFAACVYDVCACSENDDCLCDILTTYSHECAKAGIILNWRSEGLCGIHCSEEEGLVFDECGPPCQRTCENRNLTLGILASQCFKPCVPGCQCSADKVFYNGRCIRPELCP